jgi:hypothetical protein
VIDFSKLQNGDQILVRDANMVSALIRNTQGDFPWSHICSIWLIDGQWMILTTGAEWDWRQMAFVFGMVPAGDYLSKRQWCAVRRMDLSPKMQAARLDTLMRLVDRRTPYAVAKVLKLAAIGRTSGDVVNKIHREPEVYPVKVFCAEAEALSIIEAKQSFMSREDALATVNSKYPGKLEACVHTPETLYDAPEAMLVR